MKIKTECICPPIPTRHYDWACYDENTYDMTGYDGETDQPFSSCIVGYGPTEEVAIHNFVIALLVAADIFMEEFA